MQNNPIKNVMENSYESSYSIIYEYDEISEIIHNDDSSNEGSVDKDEVTIDHNDLIWFPGIEDLAES